MKSVRTDPLTAQQESGTARNTGRWLRPIGVLAILSMVAAGFWMAWPVNRSTEPGESFRYDITALKQIPPELMIGRELAPIPVPVENPHALAVDSANRIYVGGESAIAVLEPDGRLIRKIPVDRPVSCLAIGHEGSLYAGQTDRIVVLAADDSRRTLWTVPGTNGFLTSLGVTETGVYAADAGQRMVWKFDLDGHLAGRIGARDKDRGFPGFFIPSPYFDLAIAPDGALWVVDPGRHKFINFSPDGDVLSSWERTGTDIEGFSGCCNPTHIANRSDGSFVTSEKSLVRVKIHTVTGALLGVLAGPDHFTDNTRGLDLAVDGNGRILVLNPGKAVIMIFVTEDP